MRRVYDAQPQPAIAQAELVLSALNDPPSEGFTLSEASNEKRTDNHSPSSTHTPTGITHRSAEYPSRPAKSASYAGTL
jgi:hypothetical protein